MRSKQEMGSRTERFLKRLIYNRFTFFISPIIQPFTSNLPHIKRSQYYSQWDIRWGFFRFGNGIMAYNGCGPTALAMVGRILTGDTRITPKQIALYAMAHDFYVPGKGTNWDLMLHPFFEWKILSKRVKVIKDKVFNNKYIWIASMNPGFFTNTGHFIVILGTSRSDHIKVYEPNSKFKSRVYAWKDIIPEVNALWEYSIPS